jgi:hypothetical protein
MKNTKKRVHIKRRELKRKEITVSSMAALKSATLNELRRSSCGVSPSSES